MLFTAGDIAAKLGGKVLGDRTMPLTGFQAADRARAGDLTFAENRTFFERAEQSAASAIIIEFEMSITSGLGWFRSQCISFSISFA